jgi:uncharacterized membrane protein
MAQIEHTTGLDSDCGNNVGAKMGGLRILSGIAVLLTSLHFVHGIHHFYSLNGVHGVALWTAMIFATVIDVFAFIGGCLLLCSSR